MACRTPSYPFLGAHFNRLLNGEVRVGPDARATFKRKATVVTSIYIARPNCSDRGHFGGLRHAIGLKAERNSLVQISKRLFVGHLQKLVPDVSLQDLVAGYAGVRAQALMDDGRLMDDFLLLQGAAFAHTCVQCAFAGRDRRVIGHARFNRLGKERGIFPGLDKPETVGQFGVLVMGGKEYLRGRSGGKDCYSESYAATTRHSPFADRESYPPMCFLGSHFKKTPS